MRDFSTQDVLAPSSIFLQTMDSWMDRYHAYALTPQWDPSMADDCFSVSLNRMSVRRSRPGHIFPKVISVRPIHTRSDHTITFSSNKRFRIGLFAASSKEVLRSTVCRTGINVVEQLKRFTGQLHLLTLSYNTVISTKMHEGQKLARITYPYEFRIQKPVLLKLHINARNQSMAWEFPKKKFT